MNMSSWNKGWKTTRHPGIWEKNGSYRVRLRAVVAATGSMKEVNRVFEDITLRDALEKQLELRAALQSPQPKNERPRFSSFAVSLLARKTTTGEITSRKTIDRWSSALELHLIPAFGDCFIDAITRADIEKQNEAWAKLVSVEEDDEGYSPHTVNGWLSILRVIIGTAVAELELERNPIALVKDLDTSTWHTYTEEERNSLTPVEVPQFLASVRKLVPAALCLHRARLPHGAAAFPSPASSTERGHAGPEPGGGDAAHPAVRDAWQGPGADQDEAALEAGVALGDGGNPPGAHSGHGVSGRVGTGEVGAAVPIGDRPLPRGQLSRPAVPGSDRGAQARQAHHAACDAADVPGLDAGGRGEGRGDTLDLGHLTQSMQEHYSTVALVEQREAMGKVIKLAGFGGDRRASGDRGGDREEEMKKAGQRRFL